MAFAYGRLKEIGYVAAAVASVYANPASTTSYVRLIILHNLNTTAETVILYNVPDNSEAVGTAGVTNQFWKEEVLPNETVFIEFDIPGLVLTTKNDTIQMVTDTASKVTVQVFGGTE